jgi:hypothetical protein
MSKRNRASRNNKQAQPPASKRWWLPLAAVLIVVAAAVWWMKPVAAPHTPAVPEPPNAPIAAKESNPAFQRLLGKWVRPDGGYVLEIKSADPAGKLDAGYFNPNPIHVARAQALQSGSALTVYVELQDVNYPGSNYTLTYDVSNDVLTGIYFQAIERQKFEVYFQRLK